jgi:F-type H+-transporting ATPase subunit delta
VSSTPAARTYARALMQAAGTDAARVADELDAFAAIATDAPVEWEALTAPAVGNRVRKATIDQLMADAHQLVRNVLKVMADNGRLEESVELAASFRSLVHEQERQLDVYVTSAIEFDEELASRLEQRLSAGTGKQVRLHRSVDPDIIGGLVVRHGDTLVDTSLRGRLDQLRLTLSRAPQRPVQTSSSS